MGAAGALGQVIAEDFARDGYGLALIDRAADGLAGSAERIASQGAGPVRCYVAERTDREDVDAALLQIVTDLGTPTILVANAGFARKASVEDIAPTLWSRHIDINPPGTFNICQATARHMITARKGGAICVVSSCLAKFHSDQNIACCTARPHY